MGNAKWGDTVMQKSSIKQALVEKKKLVLSSIWGLTLIAWLGLACLGFMKPTIETWVTAVTVVACLLYTSPSPRD